MSCKVANDPDGDIYLADLEATLGNVEGQVRTLEKALAMHAEVKAQDAAYALRANALGLIYLELGARAREIFEELTVAFRGLLRESDLLSARNESLFLALLVLIGTYAAVHHFVMKSPSKSRAEGRDCYALSRLVGPEPREHGLPCRLFEVLEDRRVLARLRAAIPASLPSMDEHAAAVLDAIASGEFPESFPKEMQP